MKYIDAELIKSTKGLYNDIDSCIDELLKARVGHNQENEGKALFRMEGLMVATLQQLDCIIDSFQQKQPDLPGIEESGTAITTSASIGYSCASLFPMFKRTS